MRLFGALITPTTLSLPCRRRKTAVVRSTTARCRCRRSGRRRGRQTCPCARRRGRRRHGGHAAPCARCRCSTGANCSALGARLGAAVHKCGQRAVVEPPAIAVAALVDVVAGQVDADVGAVSRQYASLDSHSPNECAGLQPPKRQKSSTARCSASPSSMRKDRERVRRRYHAPRAHKRARARRNGWPSSPRMPHNGRETPEVRRHDALSTGLVMTENARGKLNKGGGK